MNQPTTSVSKSKIDDAGVLLLDSTKHTPEEITTALSTVNSWKIKHNYPLQVFKNRLKKVSKEIDVFSFSSHRLKRVSSILKKLNRSYKNNKPTMRLTQMQDIAGCRVVMSNINQVKELYSKYYFNGYLRHKKVNLKDYVSSPKEDGYRSIHIVYKYNSDKGKKQHNDLLVEVQLRSKIQHVWATAVETVDFFTKQSLKSNIGEKEWLEFFRLVSSAFAKLEKTPVVPGTPYNEKELYLRIKNLEKQLQVIKRMKIWNNSLVYFDNYTDKKNTKYYLLELDMIVERLNISVFSDKEEKKALLTYSDIETKIFNKKEYDVVLVSVENFSLLKKAYPNYFFDTKEFIKYLNKIINKY